MTTCEEIQALHLKINKHIQHSYLEQFLSGPAIDDDLLGVYHAIFRQIYTENWLDKATSAILVHIALDTHESITDELVSNNTAIQRRQLTVLAGDYYSSLYYYLLSQIENLDLVKWLAKGIQTFNNAKMHFFGDQAINWQQRFRFLYDIETALTKHVMEGLGLDPWKEIIALLLYLKRLFAEQSSILKRDSDRGYLRHLLKTNENFYKTAKNAIESEVQRVEKELHHILASLKTPASLLDEYIIRTLERYHLDTIKRVEEG